MDNKKFELVSFALCPYVQRARSILLEKKVEHDIKFIELDNPPEWFFDVSPMEKVPILLVDGEPLFESLAICEYLDEVTEGSLYPVDPFERALNRAWIEYGNAMLNSTFTLYSTDDEKTFKRMTAELDENFDTLEEDVLKGTPFFNGDKFSIIDAVYAPIFRYHKILEQLHDFGFFDDRPNLTQWSETLLSYHSVVNSVSDDYFEKQIEMLKAQDSVFASKIV